MQKSNKKQYFLVLDTETTMGKYGVKNSEKVADFACVIVDRKGEIVAQMAVLISGVFGVEPLFYIRNESDDSIWSEQGKDRRYDKYTDMINTGQRMVASVEAVNLWLAKAVGRYNPTLTAYNLAFDSGKCANTGIDLTIFTTRFCLWHLAVNTFAYTKKYKNFVLQNHAFNPPTKYGNMTMQTNAEVMARFVLNNPELEDEPHTALEDVIYYELPILMRTIGRKSLAQILEKERGGFNWRKLQAKNHFIAK